MTLKERMQVDDPRRRFIGALGGLLLVLGVVGCAESSPPSLGREGAPTDGERSRSRPIFQNLEEGWTKFPSPPEVRSSTAATAWTGKELLVWGGYVYTGFSDEVPRSDGFAFDGRSMKWETIAASPLAARILPASAWTGDEFLIWGGSDHRGGFFADGAAYDPVTDSWRTLPSAPIGARAPLFVWTEREFIVWGTALRVEDRPQDGAAYDPATNSWRTIAEAPIELTDATAQWTGSEMLVFGAALHGGNKPESETAIGAAYNPATDTWRRLPDSSLSPQASTAAWNGREMIAWDYLHETAAYDPAEDKWRKLSDVPLEDYECSPQSVPVGNYVFGDYCGLMAVFDPAEDAWRDVTRREFAGWGFTLVAAERFVFLLGRNVDSKKETMLAYRPRTTTPSVAKCNFLRLRPTYLPWLSENEEVPPPRKIHEKNQRIAGLYWYRRTGIPPHYISLVVTTGETDARGDPIGVSLGGDIGEFHQSPAASNYIAWETNDETCNIVSLNYVRPPDSDISPDEARAQLVRVAESLQTQ
jgi:hypothetical protein